MHGLVWGQPVEGTRGCWWQNAETGSVRMGAAHTCGRSDNAEIQGCCVVEVPLKPSEDACTRELKQSVLSYRLLQFATTYRYDNTRRSN